MGRGKKKKAPQNETGQCKTHKGTQGNGNAPRATKQLMTNIITFIITVTFMIMGKCPLSEPQAAAKRNFKLNEKTKKELRLRKKIKQNKTKQKNQIKKNKK